MLQELLVRSVDPVEKLAADQRAAVAASVADIAAHSARFLGTGQRVVALECGHLVISRSRRRAACGRCGAMIRAGFDHDGFRWHGVPDTFSWPEDPLAALNEPRHGLR